MPPTAASSPPTSYPTWPPRPRGPTSPSPTAGILSRTSPAGANFSPSPRTLSP
ncbi:hypothetical protein DSO57_1015634 [Entomophthora muscae]|uniref:Uncharacterized protein n=1 Tax=Entomophthora muscae TaxID=34485 RepID=A0ACC2U3K4_9FUNG|nr:hypothetical protein DSO57_1015634 [Entomophthora muscae]